MRYLIFALLASTLTFGAAHPALSAQPGQALILVENPGPQTAAALLAEDLMVVRDLGSILLVVASPERLAALDAADLEWRILDTSLEGKTYYTAGVPAGADLAAIAPGTRVLWSAGTDAVMVATSEQVDQISGASIEVARVFMRPIRVPAAARPLPPAMALDPDPAIQQMVDQVSIAGVTAMVQRMQNFVTRHSATDSADAAARWVHDQFVSFGIDSVYYQHWSSTYSDNVVASIPGTRFPERVVVIGGHYDSTTGSSTAPAPGADDDASGTACVLECARILSQYPHDYTITFVAFAGEEQGLLGSEAYASQARTNGDDILGMVQVDMIGYLQAGDLLDLDIISNSGSAWIRDLVVEVGGFYVPGFSIVPGSLPGGASSDHASFWAAGYDAVLFFEDSGAYSPYIHTTNDVIGVSYNSEALAERSVKTAVGLLATMAKAPAVVMTHTPLGNTTDILNPYRVVAEVSALEALNPDSTFVRYSTQAGTFDVPLTVTANPNEYEGFIPAQQGGTFVDYYVSVQGVSGYRVTSPADAPLTWHRFFVGQITTAFNDEFEADSGWTVGDTGDNATAGIWVRADPVGSYSGTSPVQPEDDHTPAPGVACWVTGNAAPGQSQGTNDVDNGKTTVKSPIYDLSGLQNAGVRYYRWFTNDTGSGPETDEWAVDASSDGGATWVRIETALTSDRSWRLVERWLADYIQLTSQVRFRFIARDDSPGSIVEAAVDDFAIVVYEQPSSAVSSPEPVAPRQVVLEPVKPNPFNPWTEIRFTVPEPGGKVRLAIFDVTGREVRVLADGELLAGTTALTWDGRDGAGAAMPSAVYFCRLEAAGESRVQKLVLVR